MLRKITLENFKAFGTRQVAPLAPITLIYGPNSGGKSSLIQALLLLKQSIENPRDALTVRGASIDLASFGSILFRHDLQRTLSISVGYEAESHLEPSLWKIAEILREVEYKWSYKPSSKKKKPLLSGFSVSIDEGRILKFFAEEGTGYWYDGDDLLWPDEQSKDSLGYYLYNLNHDYEEYDFDYIAFEKYSPVIENHYLDPHLEQKLAVDFANFDDHDVDAVYSLNNYHDQFTKPLNGEIRNLVAKIKHIGPLRDAPSRYYAPDDGRVLAEMSEKEAQSMDHYLRLLDVPFELKLTEIRHELLGDLRIPVLTDRWSKTPCTLKDIGFGMSQLLPILLHGIRSNSEIMCVEQPELHLHPKLQAQLADFFIENAGLNKGDSEFDFLLPSNQWIIETHSECLVLRLQRRIREGKIRPDQVSVLYVHPVGEQGSEIKHLRLDEEGEFIDEWPDGFFEESYRELFAH